MDIGVRTTIFCGSLAVACAIDFSREIKRLKKLKKEQDGICP
jgi:hypothetical protein